MSSVQIVPEMRAAGVAQMALDTGLLTTAESVVARRYTWDPPALSLGKFQNLGPVAGVPFEVVRRPTGGRAVLHGEGFEWSFAVVFPSGALGAGPRAAVDVKTPYDIVAGAFACALRELGADLDEERAKPYQRSALCFATALRHDLVANGEKLVAIAQAKHEGRTLVHGSVLERRPPVDLVRGAEKLLGEPWQGEGLAGVGSAFAAEAIWTRVLVNLQASLRRSAAD